MRFAALTVIAAIVSVAAGFALSHYLRNSSASSPELAAVEVLDFELPDNNGQFRRFSTWSNRTVLLNFWATWCGPCREEIPDLMTLRGQYPNELEVVGLALDRPDDVLRFMDELAVDYPVLLDDGRAMSLMKHYGNRAGALPFSVLISADNKVISTTLGPVDINSLAAEINLSLTK